MAGRPVAGWTTEGYFGPGIRVETGGGSLVSVATLSQDLYEFAVELRQLAYTMPGGHEDKLVRLSERMVRYAREQAAEQQR